MSPICVWSQVDGDSGPTWILRATNDVVGSRAEERYFRMIDASGSKNFFYGPADYAAFCDARRADLCADFERVSSEWREKRLR